MKNLAVILLSVWLIGIGLVPLLGLQLPSMDLILGLLAIAAGVMILLSSTKLRLGGKYGMILLAVYLILVGLLPLLSINLHAGGLILNVLAVATGALLLFRR